MKFAIAVHGTRGDVEPCAAVALELIRRGHDVSIAVPPNLVPFVQACGITPALPYGVDSQQQLEASIFRKSWGIRNPRREWRELEDYLSQGWAQMSTTLVTLAEDADLILTGTTYQEVAANVAEHLHTPLAALHYFPFRANSVMFPRVPGWVAHTVWPVAESLYWRLMKRAEIAQRRELGLPRTRKRAIRRIVELSAVEIQAYDPMFFEGLAQEWAGRRPLIGSLTLQLGTDSDAQTDSWIREGSPPIYFGFGSMPVDCPSAAVAMITKVCAELGERALICSGYGISPTTRHHRYASCAMSIMPRSSRSAAPWSTTAEQAPPRPACAQGCRRSSCGSVPSSRCGPNGSPSSVSVPPNVFRSPHPNRSGTGCRPCWRRTAVGVPPRSPR